MLKTTFFPGYMKQPCEVQYAIVKWPEPDNLITPVCIFVRQWDGNTSLINSDEGRNSLLTKILATDLEGVAIDFVRFVVSHEADCGTLGGVPHAFEFKVRVDIDDYLAKGNRANVRSIPDQTIGGSILNFVFKDRAKREISYWSRDVVGGCAKFYVDFEERAFVSREILEKLYTAIGMSTPGTPSP